MSDTIADARGLIVACPRCHQRNRLPYERLREQPRCAHCGAAVALPAEPIEISESTAFLALTSRCALPVLVDFWAAWCGPCRMMAPELAKAATAAAGRVIVGKVDTEALPEVAAAQALRGIPTLILYSSGREVARQTGAMPSASILRFIDGSLGNA